MTDYATAKANHRHLWAMVRDTGNALSAFPTSPIGITPDHIKATPEWKQARQAYANAMQALRASTFMDDPAYRSQIRAERDKYGPKWMDCGE